MKHICVLFCLLALSACNTVAGAGKDIEAGGKAITRGAEKVGDALSN